MAKILIIDDDRSICSLLQAVIRKIGHESDSVQSLEDGHKKAVTATYDVVLLDVNLPDGNGLSLLPKLKDSPSPPEVIIITGEGDPDGA
jgi:DNA-binding response OmpR family regulator